MVHGRNQKFLCLFFFFVFKSLVGHLSPWPKPWHYYPLQMLVIWALTTQLKLFSVHIEHQEGLKNLILILLYNKDGYDISTMLIYLSLGSPPWKRDTQGYVLFDETAGLESVSEDPISPFLLNGVETYCLICSR